MSDNNNNNNNNTNNKQNQYENDFLRIVDYKFEDLLNVNPKSIRQGFIVENGINTYVAEAGAGKTLLLYSLVVYYLKKGKKIYYIDLDNPVDLPKDRGLPDKILELGKQDNIYYLNTNHYSKWYEVNKKTKGVFLKELLDNAEEGSFIFIDSLQNFVDVNDNQKASAFMELIKKYVNLKNITVFIIHHIAKSTGKAKGHTQFLDMSDVVYYIKPIRDGSFITHWECDIAKQRYSRSNKKVFVKLIDDLEIEIEDAEIDNTTKAILSYAIKLLRQQELKQSELREKIKEKFSRIGNNRILSILKEYVDKGLFVEKTGKHNTKYYSVNETSEILEQIIPLNLSEAKKELKRLIFRLKNQGVKIENIKINNAIYTNLDSILNALPSIQDDDAKNLIDTLSKYLSPSVGSFDGIDNFDDDLENKLSWLDEG